MSVISKRNSTPGTFLARCDGLDLCVQIWVRCDVSWCVEVCVCMAEHVGRGAQWRVPENCS